MRRVIGWLLWAAAARVKLAYTRTVMQDESRALIAARTDVDQAAFLRDLRAIDALPTAEPRRVLR